MLVIDMHNKGMAARSKEARAKAVERVREWRRKHPKSYEWQKERYVAARRRRRELLRGVVDSTWPKVDSTEKVGIEVDLGL